MAIEFSTLMVKLGADIRELKTKFDTAQGVVGGFAEKGAASMKTWREANQEMVRRVGRNMAIMGAAITGATIVAVKGFADFQEGMSFINTMLDEQTTRYLPEFEEGIRDLAQKSGDSFESLQKGMYDVLSAMIAPAEAMDVLTEANEAAIAGASNTAIAVDGLTTILNSYGLEADKAGDVSDWFFTIIKRGKTTFAELAPSIGKVAPIAAAAGVSLDELGAMLALLTRNGVKTDIAITSLKAVITAFQSPTKEAADMAKVLGFEMSATALKEHGLAWAMEQVNKANTEQMAALIGNVRAKLATSVATANLSDLEKDLAAQLDRTGNKTEAYNKRTADLNFQFRRLNQTFQNFMHEAIAPIIPAITSMVLKLIEVTKGVRGWIQDNPKLTETLVKIIAVMGPVLTGLGAFLIILPELVLGLELVMGAASSFSLVLVPLAAAIYFMVNRVGAATKAWAEMKQAQEGALQAQEQATNATKRLADTLGDSLEKLKSKYTDLTAEELEYIDKAKQKVGWLESGIKVTNEMTEAGERQTLVTKLSGGAETQYAAEVAKVVGVLTRNIEAREHSIEAQEKGIIITGTETEKIQSLLSVFQNEKISLETATEYREKLSKAIKDLTATQVFYTEEEKKQMVVLEKRLSFMDDEIKRIQESGMATEEKTAVLKRMGIEREEIAKVLDKLKDREASLTEEGIKGLSITETRIEYSKHLADKLREEGRSEEYITDAVKKHLEWTTKNLIETSKSIELIKNKTAAGEKSAEQIKIEKEATAELVKRYKALNAELGEGAVTKDQYKDKLNELVEAYGPLIGGTDEVIKKMNELDETDPNIQAKFEMFGFEEYEDTTDRIKRINQSIVLEGLEGDEKRIQSIKFELQNFEYVQQKKIEAERVRYETSARLSQEAHDQEMRVLMAGLQFKQGIEREKAQAEIDAKTEAFKFTQQKGEESWQRLQDEMNQETADRQKLAHLQISNIEKVAAEKLRSNAEAKEGLGDEKDGIYDLADTYNKLAETSRTTASERMSVAKEVGDAYENYARRINTISQRAAKRHKRLTGETARHVTTTTALRRAPQDIAFSSFSGFQGGSHFVPRTGDYRLHRGEKVTNAEVARGEGEGVNGVGGGGVTIVNLFKEEMVPEIMMKYPNAVLNIVGSDIARRGMTRKLIEGVAKNA